MERDGEGWICRECGNRHDGLITCFGPDEPFAWLQAGRIARLRGALERSLCTIKVGGQQQYFARGHLRIPLIDYDEPYFAWNVWVHVDEETFAQIIDTWEEPTRVELPPSKGTLDTALPYASETTGLDVELHHSAPGDVPLVVITAAGDHPLQKEQHKGMTVHRLAELNALALGA